MAQQHHPETIEAAKRLYLRRHSPKEIGIVLNVPIRTVYDWRDKGMWDHMLSHESTEDSLARRIGLLAEKENKTEFDLKEIETLTNQLIKLKKAYRDYLRAAKQSQEATDGETGGIRPKKNRKSKRKNNVSFITEADFKAKLHAKWFAYQKDLYDARMLRFRMLLKSRQIGATWYFAQEAFENAVLTGQNQLFLSATRAQAEVFRRYIVSIAREHFDVDLKGTPLVLHTAHGPAELHFLSNASSSAQSYTGNVYMDEIFWVRGFNILYKVASGMAMQKKWRKTLFSTPSSTTHQAYDLWTGDRFNQRYKKKRVEFPGFQEMQSGVMCPDDIWRKIITLEDAEKGGCQLFDRKELEREYSPSEFRNLLMCEFVSDRMGTFDMGQLETCCEDPSDWDNFNPRSARPAGNRPTWGGYDPSRFRDDATFVVGLPDLAEGGDIRVIERHKWNNKSWSWQVDQIKKITERYNMVHMGIDTTGPGSGVFEQVQQFFPRAMPIHYSVAEKTALVQKAQEVILDERLKWNSEWTTLAHAFLTIRQVTTASGGMTYASDRTERTGHADEAWAVMHMLKGEGGLLKRHGRKSRVLVC